MQGNVVDFLEQLLSVCDGMMDEGEKLMGNEGEISGQGHGESSRGDLRRELRNFREESRRGGPWTINIRSCSRSRERNRRD